MNKITCSSNHPQAPHPGADRSLTDLSLADLSALSNHQLVDRLQRLVDRDNALTAELLASMAEVDARRLYLEAACSSMFVYCTNILRMSDAQTYKRIRAARLARKCPAVLPMVHSGQVNLCTLILLAPYMTEDNGEELLQQAVHLSKRQVEKLLAKRFPSPPVPDSVRRLPRRRAGQAGQGGEAGKDTLASEPLLQRISAQPPVKPVAGPPAKPVAEQPAKPLSPAAPANQASTTLATEAKKDGHIDAASAGTVPASRDPLDPGARASGRASGRVTPLSDEAYKIQFTAGQPLYEKLRQAQELLRHQVPGGDLATVFERALDTLLPRLLKQRFAEVSRPRKPRAASRAGDASKEECTGDGAISGGEAEPSGDEVSAKRSRHIPAEVKRQVARRDGYQCTYTDKTGRRCPERGLVEFHHEQPFGKDGQHEVANVRLLCKNHNAEAARHDYGEQVMERWRVQGADRGPSPARPGASWPTPQPPEKTGSTIDRNTQDTG